MDGWMDGWMILLHLYHSVYIGGNCANPQVVLDQTAENWHCWFDYGSHTNEFKVVTLLRRSKKEH
jgi:hypothetical protein